MYKLDDNQMKVQFFLPIFSYDLQRSSLGRFEVSFKYQIYPNFKYAANPPTLIDIQYTRLQVKATCILCILET